MLGFNKRVLVLVLVAVVISGCQPKRNSMVIEQQIIDALRAENQQLRNALDKDDQSGVMKPIGLVTENAGDTEPVASNSGTNLLGDQVASESRETEIKPKMNKPEQTYVDRNGNWEVKLNIYFPAGGAYITRIMQDSIDAFVQNYAQEFPDQPIRLEGYSDHRGLRNKLLEKYENNWVLAAARGAAVANYLRWGHEIESEKFIVISRVTSRPAGSLTGVYAEQSEYRKVVLSVLRPQ